MKDRPIDLRSVRIYRPYPGELAEALLTVHAGQVAGSCAGADPDLARIAKLDDRIIGVYILQKADELTYELRHLVVEPGYRRSGLGRWLLGHALGVAESRGGRSLLVRPPARTPVPVRQLFRRFGFEEADGQWRLEFTPE